MHLKPRMEKENSGVALTCGAFHAFVIFGNYSVFFYYLDSSHIISIQSFFKKKKSVSKKVGFFAPITEKSGGVSPFLKRISSSKDQQGNSLPRGCDRPFLEKN